MPLLLLLLLARPAAPVEVHAVALGRPAPATDQPIPLAAVLTANLFAREGFEARLSVEPPGAPLVALVLSAAQAKGLGALVLSAAQAEWPAAPRSRYARAAACAAPSAARFELAPRARAEALGSLPLLPPRLGAPPTLRSAAIPAEDGGEGAWRVSFRAPSLGIYTFALLRCADDADSDDDDVAVTVTTAPLCAEGPSALAALLAARGAGDADARAPAQRGLRLRGADEAEAVLRAALLGLVMFAFLLPWLALLLPPKRGAAARGRARAAQWLLLAACALKAAEYALRLAAAAEAGGAPPLAPSGWLGEQGLALLLPDAARASAARARRAELSARLVRVCASSALLAALFAIASGHGLVRASLGPREPQACLLGVLIYALLSVLNALCEDVEGGSEACAIYGLTYQVRL